MSVRPISGIAAAALMLLLAGCVYDPYTGTYVPCCAYHPYGYYYGAPAYPTPPPPGAPAPGMGRVEPGPPDQYPPPSDQPESYQPQSYQPQSYQPQSYQPQSYQSDPYQSQPNGPAMGPAKPGMVVRFQQANVTGDGRLTLQQAQAARWKLVVRNFAAIDAGGKGYVTLDEVRAWMATRRQAAAAG